MSVNFEVDMFLWNKEKREKLWHWVEFWEVLALSQVSKSLHLTLDPLTLGLSSWSLGLSRIKDFNPGICLTGFCWIPGPPVCLYRVSKSLHFTLDPLTLGLSSWSYWSCLWWQRFCKGGGTLIIDDVDDNDNDEEEFESLGPWPCLCISKCSTNAPCHALT